MAGYDNYKPKHGGYSDNAVWFADVPEVIKKQVIAYGDLSKLVEAFGSNWEFVAMDLELKPNAIALIKMDYPLAAAAIFQCLNKWRGDKGEFATFENFIKVLNECKLATVEWDEIKAVVKHYVKHYEQQQTESKMVHS